jgi:hypothetical protein
MRTAKGRTPATPTRRLRLDLLTLVTVYVTAPNDLTWHLATSLDRVALPIMLLASLNVAAWGAVALAELRGPGFHCRAARAEFPERRCRRAGRA